MQAKKPPCLSNDRGGDKSYFGDKDARFLAGLGGNCAIFVGNDADARKRYVLDASR